MPQDGSNNYQYPPGTPGIPDTTIESESYNTFLDDLVVNDLNIARPVHRGGTGANNALGARDNLDAEVASALVTNFDSHVFESGSWYCNNGATAAPEGGSYIGTAAVHGTAGYITLIAVHIVTGARYLRQKTSGTWGAWQQVINTQADADARYVNVTGDTMSGGLNVAMANPLIGFHKTAGGGQANSVLGGLNGVSRWMLRIGNDEGETGGNTGSSFDILRFSDAGAYLGAPLNINRSTGDVRLQNTLTSDGHVVAGGNLVGGALTIENRASVQTLTVGTPTIGYTAEIHAGVDKSVSFYDGGANGITIAALNDANNAYKPLQFISSANKFNGGIKTDGDVTVVANGTAGTYYFGSTGTKYLQYDGTNFVLVGGNLSVNLVYATNGYALTGSPGSSYSLDATPVQVTVAQSGIIYILSNFSGVVIVGSTNGHTEIFACGGGQTYRFGSQNGVSTAVTSAYAAPQNGYVFYNNSGGTTTYSVISFRVRTGA